MTARPIDNCYWVRAGRLLAGEYPRTKEERSTPAKLDALLDAGVAAFIDLTEPDELLPYGHRLNGQTHERFPIPDVSVPETAVCEQALDAIDSHLAAGRVVYVHCWGGVGRTGVVIGCWLARHGSGGADGLAQLRQLWESCPKSARRESPETQDQKRFVLGWSAGQ